MPPAWQKTGLVLSEMKIKLLPDIQAAVEAEWSIARNGFLVAKRPAMGLGIDLPSPRKFHPDAVVFRIPDQPGRPGIVQLRHRSSEDEIRFDQNENGLDDLVLQPIARKDFSPQDIPPEVIAEPVGLR